MSERRFEIIGSGVRRTEGEMRNLFEAESPDVQAEGFEEWLAVDVLDRGLDL